MARLRSFSQMTGEKSCILVVLASGWKQMTWLIARAGRVPVLL